MGRSFDPLPVDEDELNDLCIRLLLYCESCRLELFTDQAELCVRHLLLVLKLNRTQNLTRITDPNKGLILHVLDSLLLSRYIHSDEQASLLDMGTGPGFPGIPLHILTRYPTVLVDSVRKKIEAVTDIISALDLSSVSAIHTRLEDFALSDYDGFPFVVARALAPLPTLLELAAPLVPLGGRLVLTKGLPKPAEVTSGLRVADIVGFALVDSDEFDLPENLGHRLIFVFQRTAESRVKLPRQNGLAKKNPLA
ncbi:methyltransferase GidB [Coriobacterium glomerans PW2]|uniref:Ribosomal RNA small subunit methyltransferase G n=1 Tax=Coriobacterium glomerans (strain ATCC 49209 / DSM 20642 / JCM 10262 / PW2) TaxID=700015 RepID=F2N9E6_CORGP|nr:16S rRNA (guanine(527)-N(7))-methyltransferase RsmG [Coriobacterium glomerans]AEB07894.1 methyltransferase GidB [Coriobacterium glomerans PW2]